MLLASTPPGIVDVFIDLESPALVRRPVYPLLVNGLLELALGRTLLDPVVAAERDVRESTIEPRLKNWHRSEAMQLPDRYAGTRLAPWLTVLAALLVLIDTVLLGRPPAGRLPAG